mgnify:CR=1 FL=1
MKKKTLICILAAAALILAAAGIFLWKFAFVDGEIVSKSAETLDLRGRNVSAEELEKARRALPETRILWDVAIGGKTFDGDAESIVTGDFTAEDVPAFARLERLQSADVSVCSDMTAIAALRDALPGVRVYWTVPLGGEGFDGESTAVTVRDAAAAEIRSALGRLPSLDSLTLTECTLTSEEQLALTEEFPAVRFVWDVTLAGRRFAGTAAALDFSGAALSADGLASVAAALPLFPALESVDFSRCGLSEELLRSFADAHPALLTVWETELFGVTFSTGDEEIEFSDIPLTVEDAAQIEALLPYMPKLKKVVMLRCGISNEDMEEINLRHENVQFVWMVQVYSYGVRTDQTFFTIYNCEYDYGVNDRLADELRYCHDMEAMDLGHMHLFGDTYFFTQMPHLKYLIISQTAHSSIPELSSLKELIYLEAGKCSMTDLTPLLGCPKLEHLNIVYKRTHDDAVAASDIEVLTQMKQLKRLYIGGNMYSDEQVERLYAELPDTEIVVNNGPETCALGWRDPEIYFEMRDAMHMYYMDGVGNTIMYNPYTGERSAYEDTNPFQR